ncbi:MAG: thioredoxin domain-containing protein, partial [Methanoregula sp.]
MPNGNAPDPELLHPDSGNRSSNRLIHEKSPYLLQHAHNPVDWYPWGNEAFSHAAQEHKPVFLSIGYSTCHWCHVMAHESFEDPAVAALLNREYICIKVDREERPDIDSVYMTVCQQMTGQGGWPLTIVMTPKKEPFFAGTYFPRVSGAGMPGLMDLLERIATLWHERQDELYQSAGDITAWVKSAPSPSSRDPDRVLLDEGFQELSRQFDPENGGFGHAPKFPAPHILIFLLRYWYLTSEPRALAMVEQTLDAIRYGGIWDHVGGGLHRYATDARWLVPHFEKMLYDQALFVLACTEAYEATGKNRYRTMADECIAYVFRDLRDPGGAFYSAEDADSPGGEGAYYTWTCDELAAALGSDDARRATSFFTLTPLPGNSYNHGKSGNNRQEQRLVLSAVTGPEPVCAEDIPGDDRSILRESIRSRLYTVREKRARPARDDKILTDTNALFCTALARAGRVFRKPAYVEAASEAMQFLSGQLSDSDRGLQHRYRDGVSGIPAFADDYAYLISALIALYGATFDPAYLYRALDLNTTFIAHFQDKEKGGFFTTSDQAEELLV